MEPEDFKVYGLFTGLLLGVYCFGWFLRDSCDKPKQSKKNGIENRYEIDSTDDGYIPRMISRSNVEYYIDDHGRQTRAKETMSFVAAKRAVWLAMKKFR